MSKTGASRPGGQSGAKSENGGLRVAVRVTPRAGRDAIVGTAPDEAARPRLLIKVAAAPSDGAANAAVVALVAKAFDVARSQVSILRGDAAREKLLLINGDPQALAARLAQIEESMA